MSAPNKITVVMMYGKQRNTQWLNSSITVGQLKERDIDYQKCIGTVIYAMDENFHDAMNDEDKIFYHGEGENNNFVVHKAIIMNIKVGIANGDDVDNETGYEAYDVFNVNAWFETLCICSDFRLEYKASTGWQRISDTRSFLDIGIDNGSTIRYYIL